MGQRKGAYRILVERPDKRAHLEHPGVNRRIILLQNFKKWDWAAWIGLI
jgi:hypothetical protein